MAAGGGRIGSAGANGKATLSDEEARRSLIDSANEWDERMRDYQW